MSRRSIVRLIAAVCAVSAAVLALGQPPKNQSRRPAPSEPRRPIEASASRPVAAGPRVVLEIGWGKQDWGRIVLELDQQRAPVTVQNFLQYVDAGFYDGVIFHRVITDGLIQTGGYTSPSERKTQGLRPAIRNEAQKGLKNAQGTVAMARAKAPDSATSEFFINVADNPRLDSDNPEGDGHGYCVFGNVVEGMDVVRRIGGVPTRISVKPPREKTIPQTPPLIRRAYREGASPRTPAPHPGPNGPRRPELPPPPVPPAPQPTPDNPNPVPPPPQPVPPEPTPEPIPQPIPPPPVPPEPPQPEPQPEPVPPPEPTPE